MGYIFRKGMLGTDVRDAHIRRFASFAEGIVARIEIFALLAGGCQFVLRTKMQGRGNGAGTVGTLSLLERMSRLEGSFP